MIRDERPPRPKRHKARRWVVERTISWLSKGRGILIRRLEAGGESAAAQLMAQLGGGAEIARELPYRLYTLCERKKRAAEALSYNGLVQSWPEISRLASEVTPAEIRQATLGL